MQSQEDSAYMEGIPGIQPSCEALRAVTTRQVIMHYHRLHHFDWRREAWGGVSKQS